MANAPIPSTTTCIPRVCSMLTSPPSPRRTTPANPSSPGSCICRGRPSRRLVQSTAISLRSAKLPRPP
eukprot:5491085-Prymnesium_polylepis.2